MSNQATEVSESNLCTVSVVKKIIGIVQCHEIATLIEFCPLLTAPMSPTSFTFGGITNTSLEITWSGPVNTDYDDFDLQWTPKDQLSVFNPYHTRTSGSRILKGLYPGRLYTFSLRTVSGSGTGQMTYSTPIYKNIRTSR